MNSAAGQVDAAGRPIAEIEVVGLEQVAEQLVRNQIRSEVGEPYDPRTVEQDIVRINHLGRFSTVRSQIEPTDENTIVLRYVLEEHPLLQAVQVVGNRALNDQELLRLVRLQRGDPIDPFLIDRGRQRIMEEYEDAGYYAAEVEVDEELLGEERALVFRVREGPRVRLRRLGFEGNEAYPTRQLRNEIETQTWLPIFRRGELNREQLDLDASRVREFYQQRGYLDAQVGRRIAISPDQRDARVHFLVEEGPRYIVENIRVQGNELFPDEQIVRNMTLERGSVYSAEQATQSRRALEDLYGRLGFIETDIAITRLFHEDEPRVDLLVEIDEGLPAMVGRLTLRGNEVTKDNVALRQVRGMRPGRPFDRSGVQETERRLRRSSLFAGGTVTVLGDPGDEMRDVLIEVQEQQTGSLNIGAGVSSDLGLIGAIDLTQRNFDIANPPTTFDEFISGRAFRGAGQYFQISLQPGSQASQYSVSFREPYLMESDFFLDTNVFYFSRRRIDYDERRVGGSLGLGRRFGDIWSGSVRARGQEVRINDIEPDAPTAVFGVEGYSALTALGLSLDRDTTDSVFYPTSGSLIELGVERVGALGGDFNFTRATASWRQFFTIDEDFFGRRSVLSVRAETGYIFDEDRAPVFETFYAGGHRTFRGFDFRGVGPRGIRADTGDPSRRAVGGEFMFLTGAQYQFPLLGTPAPGEHIGTLSGVVFTDMGTVRDSPGFGEWRASVGAGIRIMVPFVGQAPFAIDFAYPVMREPGDQRQIISFDISLPLQ
ncbi:outer membrane protein assembly factor [Phycisphaerales bacterium AB-hyl4]|uniref:Outer membrane protein assembly factor n=1 Tax=Natronomicrosphaera hydrolytica TaxID=3242702 RepID=A0ABV4U6Z8_9BACT